MKNSNFFKIAGIFLSVVMITCTVMIPNLFGVSAAVEVTDCDVTRDGIINGKDVIRVMKYMKTNHTARV